MTHTLNAVLAESATATLHYCLGQLEKATVQGTGPDGQMGAAHKIFRDHGASVMYGHPSYLNILNAFTVSGVLRPDEGGRLQFLATDADLSAIIDSRRIEVKFSLLESLGFTCLDLGLCLPQEEPSHNNQAQPMEPVPQADPTFRELSRAHTVSALTDRQQLENLAANESDLVRTFVAVNVHTNWSALETIVEQGGVAAGVARSRIRFLQQHAEKLKILVLGHQVENLEPMGAETITVLRHLTGLDLPAGSFSYGLGLLGRKMYQDVVREGSVK